MFYPFLFAHLLADFPFQTDAVFARKHRMDGLLMHGLLVMVAMVVVVRPHDMRLWLAMALIALLHTFQDYLKMRFGKALPGEPYIPFFLDQFLHIAIILGVLTGLGIELSWMPDPAMRPFILLIGYVLATWTAFIMQRIIWRNAPEVLAFINETKWLGFGLRAMLLTVIWLEMPILTLPVFAGQWFLAHNIDRRVVAADMGLGLLSSGITLLLLNTIP